MQAGNLKRGALAAAGAALAFAVTGALIKLVSGELGNPMIVFLRNLFGLCFLLPWILRSAQGRLASRRLPLHLTRALIGLSAMYCFFYALARLPLAEAMLLTYSTPLYVPVIAWLWLGERPPTLLWPLLLAGLVGVGMILRPDGGELLSAAGLAGFASGVLAAIAFTAVRSLSATEPAIRIVIYFTVSGLLLSALPLSWAWQTPSAGALALMVLTGGFATLGQFLLTRAYSMAPAARIAPFNYLVVVWALGLGWAFWDESLDRLSAIGTLIVIGSSLLVIGLRETRPQKS